MLINFVYIYIYNNTNFKTVFIKQCPFDKSIYYRLNALMKEYPSIIQFLK